MGRRYFSHGSSFGRTLSCFIVRSSAHDSVVFAVGRFRLRTRVGDASQLRSRARRKNMDSVHSPCRVDALHHAAQLLQAGLRDADGVLLLDGDEELGRHGRSLLRVREQVPLGPRRPDGGHDCLAPLEVTPGKKIAAHRNNENGRSEKRRVSRAWRRNHDDGHYRPRPGHASRAEMRSSRYSPAMLLLAAVTLLLACAPVDAAVRVRPLTSVVVLQGVPARTFRSRNVQRDFCRAWTDSIGLDERVRPRMSHAHVRERRIVR